LFLLLQRVYGTLPRAKARLPVDSQSKAQSCISEKLLTASHQTGMPHPQRCNGCRNYRTAVLRMQTAHQTQQSAAFSTVVISPAAARWASLIFSGARDKLRCKPNAR
jgi:hypothetical protein